MIDEFSHDGLGWARFSVDRKMRFRLGRKLTARAIDLPWPAERPGDLPGGGLGAWSKLVRVVFALINPSTADAFTPDRTVNKCCQFAARWGADVMEIVNLDAYRSTDPKALYLLERWQRGDTVENDAEILAACRGAHRVIAGWGNHGELDGRGLEVLEMLQRVGVQPYHLGTTQDGFPLHPLARGKAFIPIDRDPVLWDLVQVPA